MKDLKHLIYFERLLDGANNELVQQAKADGKLALGVTGYIYFVDFDRSRARQRKCRVVVMGD